MIGDMAMPADFEYRDVFLKGRPVHEPFDAFRLRHPSMDPVRRAKIIAPFDALAGFDEALASTEVLCEPRRELSDDEKEELDRRLGILHRLTRNGHLARENRVPVSVTRFIPFPDGDCGRYETVSGICRGVGPRSVAVDDTAIPLADVAGIESSTLVDGRGIFDFPEADEPPFFTLCP